MTRPRLVQVTDKPPGGGGVARVLADQARLLSGWDVAPVRLGAGGAAWPGETRLPSAAPGAAGWSPESLAAACAGADVVQLHLGFATLRPEAMAALVDAAPLVVSLHDIAPFELADLGVALGPDLRPPLPLRERLARRRWRGVRRALWRVLVSRASLVLAPGPYLARRAVEAGVPEARVAVVPPSVAVTPSAPPSAAGPVVLYAGRLSAEKGVERLIDAMARLPGATRLVVCGDGPAQEALARRAAPLGDRVIWRGAVGPGEVARAMAGARVVAMPSLVPEGFGLAGIEAMAAGRPVVGFGLGGMRDWLADGVTGYVAAPPDAVGLATALGRVLGDPALADRLGGAAAMAAGAYAEDAVARRLDAALQGVRRSGARPHAA